MDSYVSSLLLIELCLWHLVAFIALLEIKICSCFFFGVYLLKFFGLLSYAERHAQVLSIAKYLAITRGYIESIAFTQYSFGVISLPEGSAFTRGWYVLMQNSAGLSQNFYVMLIETKFLCDADRSFIFMLSCPFIFLFLCS